MIREGIVYADQNIHVFIDKVEYFQPDDAPGYRVMHNVLLKFPLREHKDKRLVLNDAPYVFADLSQDRYHHLWTEELLPVFYLKKHVQPEIKIFHLAYYLILSNNTTSRFDGIPAMPEIFSYDMFEDTEYSEILIETVYVMNADVPQYLFLFADNPDYRKELLEGGFILDKPYHEKYLQTTNQSVFIPSSRFPEKIFLSRLNELKKLDKWKQIYDQTIASDGTIEWKQAALSRIWDANGGENNARSMFTYRHMSLDTMVAIEDYFSNLGYTIIDPGEYSIPEQIEMAANATHLAGFAGTNMTNAMFAKHECVVTIITHNTNYHAFYAEMAQAVCRNVIEIPFPFDRRFHSKFNEYSLETLVAGLERFENLI